MITGKAVEDSDALKAIRRCGAPTATVLCHDQRIGLDYLTATGDFVGRTDGEPCFVLVESDALDREAIDTIRLIRSRGVRATLPLVLLCGSITSEQADHAYHAGVNSLIEGSKDMAVLAERMRAILDYWVSLNCSISQSANLM